MKKSEVYLDEVVNEEGKTEPLLRSRMVRPPDRYVLELDGKYKVTATGPVYVDGEPLDQPVDEKGLFTFAAGQVITSDSKLYVSHRKTPEPHTTIPGAILVPFGRGTIYAPEVETP